ncbi:hypothetical protein CR513_09251, partial [Mucuna pruriens]
MAKEGVKKEETNSITSNKINNGPPISTRFSSQRLPLPPRLPPITFKPHVDPPTLWGFGLQTPLTSVMVLKNNGQNSQPNDAPKRNPRVFTPISVSYSKLLKHLL